MKKRVIVWFAAAITGFVGCVGVDNGGKSAAPVRAALFVDCGARSNGAYSWLRLTTLSKELQTFPVDAKMIREGALDRADLIIMPGGYSVTESKMLGENGRAKVKEFIRNGGGWIGTCAGCFLVSESSESHPDMLNLIPYTSRGGIGKADMMFSFTADAQNLLGIRNGTRHRIKYSGGPVLVPANPVPEADIKVVATYESDINLYSSKERETMAGKVAMVAGTYGKGRIFASAVHPEVDINDHEILGAGISYVAGRRVSWELPRRKPGQLAVGLMSDSSFGVETAQMLQRLIRSGEFDLIPVNGDDIAFGALRHLDALIVPGGAEFLNRGCAGTTANQRRTKEFISRGGLLIGWGNAAGPLEKIYGSDAVLVKDGETALQKLRDFAASPAVTPPPIKTEPAEKPVKTLIYTDKGGSGYALADVIAFAPEYDVRLVSAEDIRNGALGEANLLVQPDGWSPTQYATLGDAGRKAIVDFIRNGGKYYGVGSGAFLTLEKEPSRPRLSLVPYKHDNEPVRRGSARTDIKLTKEGLKAFGGVYSVRTIQYSDGPVMVPAGSVPDTDIKVLAEYCGRTVSTCSPKPTLPMNGKAAMLGGRVGKGMVFLTGLHPEDHEVSEDIVTNSFKFITGVAPSRLRRDRVRGALSVGCVTIPDKTFGDFYIRTLLPDRRFDLIADVNANSIRHLDAVVVPCPGKDSFSAAITDFANAGGLVVAVVQTDAQRELVQKVANITVVDSYGDAIQKLAELHRKTSAQSQAL